MRKLCFIFIFLALCKIGKAQFYEVSGTVKDLTGNPIENAGLFIKGTQYFTYANDTGFYKFLLPNGTYTIIIQKEGIENYITSLKVLDSSLVLNIRVKTLVKDISALKLSSKRIDISKDIIRSIVESKEKYRLNNAYSANLYIKASEKKQTQKLDSITLKKYDDTTQTSLTEIFLKLDVAASGEILEERVAVKKQGNQDGLYWISATEGLINVYQNLLVLDGVCEVPIISPISNAGLISYKYRTENLWFDNGKKYYRIGVEPVALGNALGEGYLIVEDTTFRVLRMELTFPKMHIPEYDKFTIGQDYIYPSDSVFLITKQHFYYNRKIGRHTNAFGETNVSFDSFILDKSFNKKHFGAMLSITSTEAYKKDTNFWNSVRADSLSIQEYKYSKQRDSFKAIFESDVYKDSMQRINNKLTLMNVLFWGQTYGNYKKKKLWSFNSLLEVYKPIRVGGARLGYGFSYFKKFDNKTNLYIRPNINIGIRNKDVKGGIYAYRMFDAVKSRQIGIMFDRDFEFINNHDAWLNIFRRSNFYEVDRVRTYYRQEFFNGFYATLGFSASDRRSIDKYEFSELGDSLFAGLGDTTRNKPVEFKPYTALYGDIYVSYTPGQKYMLEPYEKIILGSKWPTFGVTYKRGIPRLINSTIDFEYLNFEITQVLKMGLVGKMNYRFSSGKFLQKKDLRLVDYIFQANGNPYFFSNPNYTFQSLDSVYRTFDWFFEGHVLHRFNGAILNKIPLLKKLHLVEAVGGGFLISPENRLKYFEAYAGLERSFRFFSQQLRLGFYLVGAQSNRFEVPLRLKFSLEFYDKENNRWSF